METINDMNISYNVVAIDISFLSQDASISCT